MALSKKKTAEETTMEIIPLETKRVVIKIEGDTPLIMHKWSEKAKKQILAKETKDTKAKTKSRDVKSPAKDFVTSMYWLNGEPDWDELSTEEQVMEAFYKAVEDGARFGFPATSVKCAAMASAYRLGWIENQMGLRGSFFIRTDEKDDLIEIKYTTPPEMREDMVKVGMGTADIRYRGMFPKWHADLTIEYNASGKYTLEQIINFINAGGFCCGIGEWRPEKDGDFGRFHVVTA